MDNGRIVVESLYLVGMPNSPRVRVRPTSRFLRDLGLSFPKLEEPLWRISHPLVAHMQKTPDAVRVGGASVLVSEGTMEIRA